MYKNFLYMNQEDIRLHQIEQELKQLKKEKIELEQAIKDQEKIIHKKEIAKKEFNKRKDKEIKQKDKNIDQLKQIKTQAQQNIQELQKKSKEIQLKKQIIDKEVKILKEEIDEIKKNLTDKGMTTEQIDCYIKQAIQISEEKNQEQTPSTEASNNSGDTINNSELDDAGTTFLESHNQATISEEGNNSTDHTVVGDNTEASSEELAELLEGLKI